MIWKLLASCLVVVSLSTAYFSSDSEQVSVPLVTARATKPQKKPVKLEIPKLLPQKVVKPAKVSVLTFHELSQVFQPGSLLTKVGNFENMLRNLRTQGYQTFFVSQIADLIEGRDVGLQKGCKPIVITFDDGYRNNYNMLFPLLKKYRMKATIFLIVGKIVEERVMATGNTLTWSELSEMSASGCIEFGSHTYDSHCNLKQKIQSSKDKVACWRSLYRDLRKARRVLKERLGKDIVSLAWPHGKNTAHLRKLARMTGHRLVFNTRFGTNVPGHCDYFDLCRISASSPFLCHKALLKRLWLAERGRALNGRPMRIAAMTGQF